MAYPQYGNGAYGNQQYSYQYPGYEPSAQQAHYQNTPPQIRNPFAPPPPSRSQYGAQNVGFDPEHEQEIAQWQAQYAPQEQIDKKSGKDGKAGNPNLTALGVRQGSKEDAPTESRASVSTNLNATATADGEKKRTVVRKGGGETWEDDTLLEWDPSKFRIYVGNLAGEVTDDSLAKAFAAYDVNKARVVRDKRTTKSKGFGFVEFQDHELGFKAAREMVGKYIGSHPVTIEKAKTDVKSSMHKDKKGKYGKNKDRGNKKQDDPLRANTGAHIEKKPVRSAAGMKLLG